MITLSRPAIGEDEIAAVVEVLESGMLAQGERVSGFEGAFAETMGTEFAIAVGSGTAALHVGLLAMGIGADDEVIVPSFTFAATANAVAMTGAEPVFVDIDPSDFTIHAAAIRPAITPRTRAVIPVHLYGQPAPMAEILELARDREIDVIEDAAQAHLARSNDMMVGSMGRFGAFSFYPTKNMTTGEGGMITTSDPHLALKARMIRNQGMADRYDHRVIGLNERMTELEAAMGLVQLKKLAQWTDRRREVASAYSDRLDTRLVPPTEREDAYHVYHQYTLAPADRDPVISALRDTGIGFGVYYPRGTHQQEPYRTGNYDLPVTEEMVKRVVSIPVRPDLSSEEIDLVVHTLNGVFS